VLFAITTLVNAQDFRPGFIVTSQGDSLTGLVANRTSRTNSSQCRFKQNEKSEVVRYAPADLRSYGIYGYKQYRAEEIFIRGRKQRVFLELLIAGNMSLLSYRDIFFLQKDSLVLLPRPAKQTVQENGKTFNAVDQRYVGIVRAMMKDCALKDGQFLYNESTFTDRVNRYNECLGKPGIEIKGKVPRNRITLSILSGVDYGQVHADADKPYGMHIKVNQFKFNTSLSVPVGMGLEWSTPRRNDKRFFGIEVWYDKKFYQGFAEANTNGAMLRSDLIMQVSYLKVPLNLRFNLRREENTPYVRIGFTEYFTLTASSEYRDESEVNGVVSTTDDNTPIQKKNAEGFWLGAGYSRRLFQEVAGFVELRYELNTGFTYPTPGSKASGGAANLLIGIKF
jgi:hypothetical protein